ncbi:MAG: chromosome partitioning protein, ParB family [Parcubacteria group bacterium Gr01-1014_106]|nr:MAG: chromosome partitioning protein, ParB family [Parcubacteria group bacterium Gr01-1014_106]
MEETSTGNREQGTGDRILPTAATLPAPQFVVEIPVSRIERNPKQPRIEFSEAEIEELANSIREHGVLQPLLVVRKPLEPGQPEKFEIIAGERRWRASQRAGLATVPCIIRDDLSERERLEIALVENLQRKDLNAIEEGMAYRRLHTEFGLTHGEIATRVGKSRPAVSNTLRLLELPEQMQSGLAKGEINYGQARALLSVLDPLQRQAIFEKMQKGEISARVLERMQRGRKPRRARKEGDPEVLSFERELAQTLGTPVRIKPLGPGGIIEVDYFSWEELSGIIERIVKEREAKAASQEPPSAPLASVSDT